MSDDFSVFRSFLRKHERMYANWPIEANIEFGDYGIMIGNQFKYQGNVTKDFNLKLKISKSESKGSTYLFSERVVFGNITSKVLNDSNRSFSCSVKFQSDNQVIFRGLNTCHNKILNLQELGGEIASLYNTGKWKKEFFIVVEIIRVDSCLLIIGNKNGGFQLQWSGGIKEAQAALEANIGMSVSRSKNLSTKRTIEKASPMFSLSRLNLGFWGDQRVLLPTASGPELPSDNDKDLLTKTFPEEE